MLITLSFLLLGAVPGQDAGQDAFKSMEQQILKAKSLQVQLEVAVEPGKDNLLKGRMLVAAGNKVRMDFDGSLQGKNRKMAMVSDGTKMRLSGDDAPGKDQEVNKQLTDIALGSASRIGVFTPLILISEATGEKPAFDLAKDYAVSEIKLGKKETLGGKEAQVLEYKVATRSLKEPLTVTVWLDAKTNLPLKRVVKNDAGQEKFTITETYAKVILDEKIDDKEFTLPK